MKFKIPYSPANPESLLQFQRERGFVLPESYCEFLLLYNGGSQPIDKCYADVPEWNQLMINQFLGLTESSDSSISAKRFSNFSQNIDRQLLVIGYDVADQELIMDLRLTSYGKIYIRNFVDPRAGVLLVDDTGFAAADYNEAELLVPIARSFESLMAMLGPEPEEEE